MILIFAVPFLGFAQDDWGDDLYTSSKKGKNKKTEKPSPAKNNRQYNSKSPAKVMVVHNNGDITMESEGNVSIDVDAYNRRGMTEYNTTYSQDQIQDSGEYDDYEYTDRIVKFHNPQNSVTISSKNDINVYVVDDVYSDYYRNRGWNFNVNLGWGPFYYSTWSDWYDPWYYPSYYVSYNYWYNRPYYSWSCGYYPPYWRHHHCWNGWSRPYYYSSRPVYYGPRGSSPYYASRGSSSYGRGSSARSNYNSTERVSSGRGSSSGISTRPSYNSTSSSRGSSSTNNSRSSSYTPSRSSSTNSRSSYSPSSSSYGRSSGSYGGGSSRSGNSGSSSRGSGGRGR